MYACGWIMFFGLKLQLFGAFLVTLDSVRVRPATYHVLHT